MQSVLHLSGIDRGGAARRPPRQPFGALRDRVVQGKPRRGGRARQLRARLRRARDHEGGADSGWLTQGAGEAAEIKESFLRRSEEHKSELQSLMRNTYYVI